MDNCGVGSDSDYNLQSGDYPSVLWKLRDLAGYFLSGNTDRQSN